MDIVNYFDLKEILVNELFGDINLFVIIGMLLVFYICLKKQVPASVMTLLIIIFNAIIYAHYPSITAMWVFTVTGVGLIFYLGLSKIIRRG